MGAEWSNEGWQRGFEHVQRHRYVRKPRNTFKKHPLSGVQNRVILGAFSKENGEFSDLAPFKRNFNALNELIRVKLCVIVCLSVKIGQKHPIFSKKSSKMTIFQDFGEKWEF